MQKEREGERWREQKGENVCMWVSGGEGFAAGQSD